MLIQQQDLSYIDKRKAEAQWWVITTWEKDMTAD